MQLTLRLTAGQRDALKDLLYEQSQVPAFMPSGMARSIYEEIERADEMRKRRALQTDLGRA